MPRVGFVLADNSSLDELAQMDGWAVDGARATFRPLDAGWSALLTYRAVFGRSYNRWHMSLIDPRQRCREVSLRSRLADARYLAEGRVVAQNRAAA
jgi:hypothetical protein